MLKLTQLILMMLALFPFYLFGENPPELEKLRSDMEEEMRALTKPITDLNTKYETYLEQRRDSYQKDGSLEAVIAVEKEIAEFRVHGADVSAFPELARLQKIYRGELNRLEKERAVKALPVFQVYQKKAEELSTQWTRINRIHGAKLAKEEAERLGRLVNGKESMTEIQPASKPTGKTGVYEGTRAGEVTINSVGMKLCWIPAGKFEMGSPIDEEGRTDHENQVRVSLSEGYWIGTYEVTQKEFESVMGLNPSKKRDSDFPVTDVDWNQSMEFCKELSEREHKLGLIPEGWTYSLPTEAQWEYACRAGNAGPFSGGEIQEVGWFEGNSGGSVHKVGTKKGNEWGIHDMHGNVREWCFGIFSEDLEGGRDPSGPTSGERRPLRGGSWFYPANLCRAALRGGREPSASDFHLGFRVVVVSDRR